MQSLEGGATGPNGRDSRTVRSAEQEDPAGPDPTPGRGSLMARYRGAGLPTPGGEDQSMPPLPRPGETTPGPPPGSAPGGGSTAPGGGSTAPAGGPVAPGRPPAGPPSDSPWRQQSSWTSAPPVPPAPPTPAVPPAGPSSSALATTDKPTDKPADKPADKAVESPADTAAEAPVRPASDRPADVERPGTGTDAGTPARGTAPDRTDAGGLLTAERAAEFTRRWRDLQADFVDDPQAAVRGAGDLSREILQALSDRIAAAERVDSWKAEDGTSGTEDLRIALRQYRALVERLLEL